MKTTDEWLGWMEYDDSDEDELNGVEMARLQKLAEYPELGNMVLGLMRIQQRTYRGESE